VARLRRRLTLLGAALVASCVATLATGAVASFNPQGTLEGVVVGDGAPRAGYEVSLRVHYFIGGRHETLLGTDRTDADGRFEIDYRLVPGAPRHLDPVLYVVAEKGPSMLTSVLSDQPSGRIVVNERTTVAMASAFAQFVDGRVIDGNDVGVYNAARVAGTMADPESGQLAAVLNRPPNAGQTSTRATFNTLANIVAGCVDSSSDCETLFELATPPGGGPPTTVLQALANMTKYPSRHVSELFALSSGGLYAPALDVAPASWLLFLKFTGSFSEEYARTNLMSGPGNVAFDERGIAWINDNYVPTAEHEVACAGLRVLKIQPWGEPFPGTPYFGGGLSGAGFGITVDPKSNVWVGNFGFEAPVCASLVPPDPARKIPASHDSVSVFRPNGMPISPDDGFTGGDISWPQATVSDRDGNIWLANCGNDTVTLVPKGNPGRARNIPLPNGRGAGDDEPLLKPFGLAIDPTGRAWVTGNKANEVYVVSRDGTVDTVETNGLLSWPMGISGDSQGNMWVSSSDAVNVPCVTPLERRNSLDPAVVLFPADGSPPRKYIGGGLSVPWGNAVDGDDTLWVFNFGRNPMDGIDEGTIWEDTGVSRFCGADESKCPAGKRKGDPISPPRTGYSSDALDRVTGGGIDPSGNLWLVNNWKQNGPFPPDYNTNPGGNSYVIVPGAAAPVRTPLLGPPRTFDH
jgi:hypothetical protein